MDDIIFVQMPFAGVERPSLALGLFTAALRGAGIATQAIYANIAFTEKVGVPSYALVQQATPHMLVGDWVFAPSLFEGAAGESNDVPLDQDAFPVKRELIVDLIAAAGHAELAPVLLELRRRAVEFIDELADEIGARRPRVLACTSMFDQHVAALALLKAVKQRWPEILTVIGGANCAGPMGRATHHAFRHVDFTVTGEFDPWVVEFFTALRDARGDAARIARLPPNVLGPHDRAPERRHLPLPPSALTLDMDALPVPDYDDYFEQVYSSPIAPYVVSSLPFEASRGCWWGAKQHCTFCGLNAEGMAYRRKSPERALGEIRALTQRYRVERCFATDNIIDMSYFSTVLPRLAADGRPYRIFFETKANLKREHIEALAAAGCTRIQPGVESLHDETLKIMKKGTTACANIHLLKHCIEFGVAPAWSILCDFPGSDPRWVAQVARDFPALFHLPPPFGTVPIRFDRFSPYHQRPEEYGLQLEPMTMYHAVYPLAPDVVSELAYFFKDKRPMSRAVGENAYYSDQMTKRWRAEFWSSQRAELVLQADDGEVVRVRDTRACATAATHELRGRDAILLRALDSPATPEALRSRLTAAGWDKADESGLNETLERLAERHLIWRSDTQLIALPTRPPRRRLRQGLAMGEMLIHKYLRESAAVDVFSS